MRALQIHTRIIQHPFASLMQGARLDSYHEDRHELVLDVQGFQSSKSEIFERDGEIIERITGAFVPLRLTFKNVSKLKRSNFLTVLEDYKLDDPSRIIAYMLSWQQAKKRDIFYMFGLRGTASADMQFHANRVDCENLDGEREPFTIERDWSPPPPMTDRLVPQPKYLYRLYGGDPITIHSNGKIHHRQLFIGSLENQPKYRPKVNAVLNLGEKSSRWVRGRTLNPNDRAINRGEGPQGMTVADMREEANWVIERLKSDQRVLVHCVAGMNRSTTICCAILILLEGLSAEDALARIREHHPWARPDSYHWLALRWLAQC